MKIAPIKTSDPWLGRVLGNKDVHAQGLRGVPVETTVEIEMVEIRHRSPEENYRPYLHVRGELSSVKPQIPLPYGITELIHRPGSGTRIDAFYEFTHEQLADLVKKGYFTEDFKVPETMSGIPWELPGAADFVIVAPELMEDPPVVFMDVQDSTGLSLDEASSGYDLALYFPDYSEQAQKRAEAQVDASLDRNGSGRDLFADMEYEEILRQQDAPQMRHAESETELETEGVALPDGVFTRLVEEITAKHEQSFPVVEESEAEVDPQSAEGVYRSLFPSGTRPAPVADPLIEVEDEPVVPPAVVEEIVAEAAVPKEEVMDLFDNEDIEEEEELAPRPLIPTDEGTKASRTRSGERARRRLLEQIAEDEAAKAASEQQQQLD